jgi:hypothetical protein
MTFALPWPGPALGLDPIASEPCTERQDKHSAYSIRTTGYGTALSVDRSVEGFKLLGFLCWSGLCRPCRSGGPALTMSALFSAIMIPGALVLPEIIASTIDASMTRTSALFDDASSDLYARR